MQTLIERGCGFYRRHAEPPEFQSCHKNTKATFLLQLTLERLESPAHKLDHLSATHTGHVDVVPAELALVVAAFAVQIHNVEFVNQTLPLQ
jgi:hypothetical protein